jgi:hypothetical protein
VIRQLTRALYRFRAASLSGLVMLQTTALASPFEETFNQAAQGLEKGAFSDALVRLERLSDEGFVHPDASFNRAVAYLKRAASAQSKPGDLGQAVAGLRETVVLREDEEAEALIETVRLRISRQRAAKGRDPVVASPTLGRALSDTLSLSTWASVFVVASGALCISLVLRARSTRPTWTLGSTIASLTSFAIVLVFGGMHALSYHYATTTEEAVVTAEQASLRDKDGKPMLSKTGATNSSEVPEGASVYVVARNSRLWKVQWGTAEGWLRDSDLRLLATR